MLQNKKGLAKEELVILIILIISFAFLTIFLIFLSTQSDDASKELACRISVLQRAALQDPVLGLSAGKLFCETIEKDIGKKESAQKEAVIHQLAEQTVKCWNMFGEGALSTLKDKGDLFSVAAAKIPFNFGWGEDKAFCFVCYDVDVYDIKDNDGKTTTISKGEFEGYLSSTVYIAEAGGVELNCNNGEDDDGDKLIDCDDDDCVDPRNSGNCIVNSYYIKNPCAAQGGRCSTTCEPYAELEDVDPEWACEDKNKKCCVSKNNAYTYTSYIYDHGGNGGQFGALDYDNGLLFEPGENYAIAYVEPLDDGQKDSYIMVGKYLDIAQYCQVK